MENGFEGCMQNLNLNGQDLPLTGSSGGTTADRHGVQPGCQTSGTCKTNPCPLDRMCVETFVGHQCECLPGHSGADCKAFVTCSASPCRNGGTCHTGGVGYSCACPPLFEGLQCHVSHACASSPCENGGTCEQTSAGSDGFRCRCPAGFTGRKCEADVSCQEEPCKYGGACNNDGTCSCADGFTGRDCGLDVDECLGAPCKNGGVCKNTFGSFRCNCSTSDYGGQFCDAVVPDIDASTGDWPLGKGEIIGIGVFLFVILLIVLLAVILLRRRAKRKKSKALKVSPPVVGLNVDSPDPPTPPPRQLGSYDDEEASIPPTYDSEDSWRRQRAAKDFGSAKLTKASDANLSGYSWDFADLGKDSFPMRQRQSACASLEEGKPEVPQRPRNYRISESEDADALHVPHVPKKPALYVNPRGKGGSRFSVDGSEISEYTDVDHADVFRGRFPRPPREAYPESLDQHPVGSYAPTMMTGRESELESVADFTEDDLERVYLGNRLEICDDSPENTYLHSETFSDEEHDENGYAPVPQDDVEFHKTLQREIKTMMDELEDLKMESEL